MKTVAALAFSALLLSGCMVVPVAERPAARPVLIAPVPAYPDHRYRYRHHRRAWR